MISCLLVGGVTQSSLHFSGGNYGYHSEDCTSLLYPGPDKCICGVISYQSLGANATLS